MREKTVYLSVCMTPQQLAKLSELAKRTERTKGAVLRLLIDGTSVEELERLATRGPARKALWGNVSMAPTGSEK